MGMRGCGGAGWASAGWAYSASAAPVPGYGTGSVSCVCVTLVRYRRGVGRLGAVLCARVVSRLRMYRAGRHDGAASMPVCLLALGARRGRGRLVCGLITTENGRSLRGVWGAVAMRTLYSVDQVSQKLPWGNPRFSFGATQCFTVLQPSPTASSRFQRSSTA